ncbi:mitochondrial carrier [Cystobasidium minutum MCA 4210]|uniref:mitochondrial carrier n=1 Tax=Cystobasidium minutum MCA 4210 TaxID=1397322 RepID=UPI0034CE60DE|eukprot:jgi/Rhomi1/165572/fgenesh1_kg.1_\
MGQDDDGAAATTTARLDKGKGRATDHEEPGIVDDLIAGWIGGAVGILASNPLEVLKVRMQTALPPTAAAAQPSTSRVGAGSRPPSSTREGLIMLWKTEGAKFLIAGAAAPILGLAIIDSTFFALYGRSMSFFQQERQNPADLSKVFASGAMAGGVCALLQTPIEVIKCRAQNEPQKGPKTLGSLGITKLIIQQEGLKGFYHGGLTTALHDTFSSGIFFSAYIVFKRILRNEAPFSPSPSSSSHQLPSDTSTPIPELAEPLESSASSYTGEIVRTLIAGGVAGSLSAILTYPLDIIKTRLQTHHSQPAPTLTSTARQIYQEGIQSYTYSYPQSIEHSLLRSISQLKTTWHPGERSAFLQNWSTKLLALRAYFVGYRPTIASSFIGSAATITCVEAILLALSKFKER